MATFSLNVTTDDSSELLDIVSKIAGSMPLPIPHEQAKVLMEQRKADILEAMSAQTPAEAASTTAGDELPQPDPELVPERDAHGIKRDLRIHADAKDPLRASDNLWKRRKNVPDEQYEEIHLELVREARSAGLYTGPAIPELELEDRVVDTVADADEAASQEAFQASSDEHERTATAGESAPVPGNTPLAANPNASLPVEVAPPAPTAPPAPVPAAPVSGMSAEATPTYQQAVVALFNAGGPTAPQVALQAMGLTIATQATPQQLRDMVTVAEMVTALGIAPADKPAKGPEHTREALAALGYVA